MGGDKVQGITGKRVQFGFRATWGWGVALAIALLAHANGAQASGPLVPGEIVAVKSGTATSIIRIQGNAPFATTTIKDSSSIAPFNFLFITVDGRDTVVAVAIDQAWPNFTNRVYEINVPSGSMVLLTEIPPSAFPAASVVAGSIGLAPNGDILLGMGQTPYTTSTYDAVIRIDRANPSNWSFVTQNVADGGVYWIDSTPEGDIIFSGNFTVPSFHRVDGATGAHEVVPSGRPIGARLIDMDRQSGNVVLANANDLDDPMTLSHWDPASETVDTLLPGHFIYSSYGALVAEPTGKVLFHVDTSGGGLSVFGEPTLHISGPSLARFNPSNLTLTTISTANLLDVEVVFPACSDGIDDDGDGLTDAQDPNCTGPADNKEAPDGCSVGATTMFSPWAALMIGLLGLRQRRRRAGTR